MLWCFELGQECESDGSRGYDWSIRRQGGVHRNAALQACRWRRATPRLTTFFLLLISFVLTGVDETKATANEGFGGVERLLKGGSGRLRPVFP